MIRLANIKIPANLGDGGLEKAAARALGVDAGAVGQIRILRRSVDARKKPRVFYLYTLAVEVRDEKRLLQRGFEPWTEPAPYAFPGEGKRPEKPVVVVGMGPAGLFAAYCLTEAGVPCVLLERGQCVERRRQDVDRFWQTGALDEGSNVQFGEGGAGTFSDGKLATGIRDGRIPFVLDTFVKFGAPADIRYLAAPHVGTDHLCRVVANMRRALLSGGCEIRFGTKLTGITIRDGRVTAVTCSGQTGTETLSADHVILAPGNSARDTFRMLREAGISCRIVTGIAVDDTGQKEFHAWNIVALDGVYYALDATWDAELEPDMPYEYFLRGTAGLTDHRLDEAFLTKAFQQAYPMAEADHSAP